MKKIILCLTLASVAFAMFLVPCSAFTISPDGYTSDGVYGSITYPITGGAFDGQNASIPISVSARIPNSSSASISQKYTPDDVTPRGFTLSRIRVSGFPGSSNGGTTTYTLKLAVQYTPAQLSALLGYSATLTDEVLSKYILLGIYPSGSGNFVDTFQVQIIRHYSDGSKGVSTFIGSNNSQVLRYQDTAAEPIHRRQIFTSDTIATSFVVTADIVAIDANHIDILVPGNYSYSTLYDDLARNQEEEVINDAYNQGYGDATTRWEETNFNPFTWFADMVGSFLDTPLYGDFTLGGLVLLIFGVLALKAILSLIAGG